MLSPEFSTALSDHFSKEWKEMIFFKGKEFNQIPSETL